MRILQTNQAYSLVGEKVVFSHSNVFFADEDDTFLAQFPQQTVPAEISRSFLHNITLIRKASYRPAPPATATILPTPGDFYVKRPDLMAAGSVDLASLVLRELNVCETLKKHPHPNVATYHGCLVSEGLVTGLCFTRYPQTLAGKLNPDSLNKSEFMKMEDFAAARKLAAENCLAGIEAGIRHLHALNIVHNDLNPANIAMTEDGVPVNIDFDSSSAPGAALDGIKRTRGWYDRKDKVARTDNDLKALLELRVWLSGSSPEEYQFRDL
ncbi:hypothetical protein MCOR34_011955 [Pyricularia oryzae]|uniref:Protein kinase domain-containing protein n=1 Tax=Pyricularia oryzae TaxID=318829 RepID=A0A4P7NCU0_PYROR|nr:hypothetical protein MCOR34_011955 [Pyricularia oryzae]KAI6443694.1 hypothetical protein MCOR17_011358 [Pyricularia oryzae]KAI6546537.1 hypothetical protein MCOR04_011783 [Pyricularia oryzae]QBZ58434.1 hypothetical protein PoMZ_03386 [Pyricularia oryzae]